MKNFTSPIDFDINEIDLSLSEWSNGSQKQVERNTAYLKLFASSPLYQHTAAQLVPYMEGAIEVIRVTQPNLSFCLESIFGTEQWKSWSKHCRRLLGSVFAKIVRSGLLPIKFDPSPKKGKMRHYILKHR